MTLLDQVIKIIKAFKPVEIKNEIKNPTFSPQVSYKSPTTNNITFNSYTIDQKQLTTLADSISKDFIKTIENQVIGTIATDSSVQKEISRIPEEKLPLFLRSAVSGTATITQVQPDFIERGTFIFPKAEQFLKQGFEEARKTNEKILSVKISKVGKNEIKIRYEY